MGGHGVGWLRLEGAARQGAVGEHAFDAGAVLPYSGQPLSSGICRRRPSQIGGQERRPASQSERRKCGSPRNPSHCDPAPPPRLRRVPAPSRSLKTEQREPKASAGSSGNSGLRGCKVNALKRTTVSVPVGCKGSVPRTAGSPIAPVRQRIGTVSMESLILAQDERWRRA